VAIIIVIAIEEEGELFGRSTQEYMMELFSYGMCQSAKNKKFMHISVYG
jgi:hypothetical protein